MHTLEQAAHDAWARWGQEWVFYGRCTKCGRVRETVSGRPLLVRGPSRKKVLCLDCYDRGK